MLTLYLVLKWIHVVLAITALGANITYGIWIARSVRAPEHHAHVLRTVKFIDDRIANPAYVLLLLTGLGMVLLPAGPSLTTPWLLISLALYVVAMSLGFLMYTPALRRQIEAAEQIGVDSEQYKVTAAQGRQLGLIIGVLVVVIVFLMVVKPGFGLPAPAGP
jgi:uncharacterized membrane protein